MRPGTPTHSAVLPHQGGGTFADFRAIDSKHQLNLNLRDHFIAPMACQHIADRIGEG